MQLAEVQARLDADPLFAGRLHGAAKLAQLSERGQLAQAGVAAFVLPLGLSGGQPRDATGLFIQPLDRMIGVVIALRNLADATGEKGWQELEPLIDAAIAQLCGWAPDDAIGQLRLVKGELVSIVAGTITYQLDFALDDQLRITRNA